MDDPALMGLIARGDEDALRILISRHQPAVFGFFMRSTGSVEDAEDLTQQLFINLYRKAGSYRETASFKTFMYRIASNLAVSQARKRKKDKTIPLDEESAGGIALPSADSDPMSDLERKELEEGFEREISKLPEEHRRILELRVSAGLSYREIAEVTGRSVSAVETIIFRARERIAEGMGHKRK